MTPSSILQVQAQILLDIDLGAGVRIFGLESWKHHLSYERCPFEYRSLVGVIFIPDGET